MSKKFNPLAAFAKRKGKDFFGWPAWHTLHCFAVKYTPKKREAARNLAKGYIGLLPCDLCGGNFEEKVERKFPLEDYLDNNHNFFFWTYLVHDAVNQYRGVASPPYDQVKSIYFGALDEHCNDCRVSL